MAERDQWAWEVGREKCRSCTWDRVIALMQTGGCLAGNGSAGKEPCCREKLLGSCKLKQIKIEAVH